MVKTGNDLAERLIQFAVRIIKITKKLDSSYAAKHIGEQLLRSGTSPGANYEEARGAESRKDFIHKMGIVLKELKESRYWLKLLNKSDIITGQDIESLSSECEELCAIIAKSIMTAKSKK